MSDTRTGPAVQKLVDFIQEDLSEAAGHLQQGLDMVRALEGETRGVNGLSAFLKSQGNALEKMVSDMAEEAQSVAKKMLGSNRTEVVTVVNPELAEEVATAKGVES